MARSRAPGLLDTELDALPPELRWREWMARVEAIIFASSAPVARDVLARVVGKECSIDLLMEDIDHELAGRPYEIVAVAGGWQFRTRTRHAQVLRAAFAELSDAAQITETEMLALASIAYHQPITRNGLANVLGREISRDVIARLRELAFVASGPRSPQPGAPYTYVTTKKFLEHFGLDTLGDLPDIDALQEAGLLEEGKGGDREGLFAPLLDDDDEDAGWRPELSDD
jgi:segregation and condensation protein B